MTLCVSILKTLALSFGCIAHVCFSVSSFHLCRCVYVAIIDTDVSITGQSLNMSTSRENMVGTVTKCCDHNCNFGKGSNQCEAKTMFELTSKAMEEEPTSFFIRKGYRMPGTYLVKMLGVVTLM